MSPRRGLSDRILITAAVLALACQAGSVAAQDAHYWTQTYGSRSTLLNGAVIGSHLDLSAIYYNPGALVMLEEYEFLLSANVLEYNSVSLEGDFDFEMDFSSWSLLPDLITVGLPADWLSAHQLAFCYLKRQRGEGITDSRRVEELDAIRTASGLELVAGEVIIDQKLDEDWYGLGWARKLGEGAGIGATTVIAYRSQRTRLQAHSEALAQDGSVATSFAADEINYSHYRALWKLGLALDYAPLTFGVAVTTPSVGLFGTGDALSNRTVSGLDTDGDGFIDPEFSVSYQEGIDSEYASSWAAGVGAAYAFGRSRLHFSAEWYNAIDELKVLDTAPFYSQSSGEELPFELVKELDSVVNWGVGVEHTFDNGVSAYGSFATDYSAIVEGTDADLVLARWDIYHITGGASFSLAKTQFNAGLGYSFGSDTRTWRYTLSNMSDANALLGDREAAEVGFERVKLIFGFSFDI